MKHARAESLQPVASADVIENEIGIESDAPSIGEASPISEAKAVGPDEPFAGDYDERERAAILNVVDNLATGVIVWNAQNRCELVSQRALELLEFDETFLHTGAEREEVTKKSVRSGKSTPEESARVSEKFASGEAFSFTRHRPSGKSVLTSATPRPSGGYVVTLADVTEFHTSQSEMAKAKARAEKMERKLTAELARLNTEKAEIEKREAELQRLSLVAAHAKDLIVISDARHRIVWANEAFRRHNGLDLEMDLIGKSGRDVLSGVKTDAAKLALIDEAIRNRQSITLDLICYKRSGEDYWMEQEIIPVFNERGEHTNFIMVGRDISERKRAEIAAEDARRFEDSKRAESKLLSEFNEWLQSSDNLDELFVVVSSFLEKLLPGSRGAVYNYGESREVLTPVCVWGEGAADDHFEPSDCWALRRGRTYFFGENPVDIPCNHVRRRYGVDIPSRQYCMPIIAHGDTVGLLSIDMSDAENDDTRKLASFCAEQISLAIANVRLREQLRDQSTRDPLTSLFNRRYFLDFARREIDRCASQNKPASLISFDVDHFKSFNDNFGHDAGDAVLRSLADGLQAMFRESDAPCRVGGEEFIVMLPGADIERAMERAEELRAAIEEKSVRYGGETLSVTISAGVAAFPKHGPDLQSLMQGADEALYAAKNGGRNQVCEAKA